MTLPLASRAPISAGHNISITFSSVDTQSVHVAGLVARAPCPAKYMMIATSPGTIFGLPSSCLNRSIIADLVACSSRRLMILSAATPRSARR